MDGKASLLWKLDSFMKVGENEKALIHTDKKHSLTQMARLTFGGTTVTGGHALDANQNVTVLLDKTDGLRPLFNNRQLIRRCSNTSLSVHSVMATHSKAGDIRAKVGSIAKALSAVDISRLLVLRRNRKRDEFVKPVKRLRRTNK